VLVRKVVYDKAMRVMQKVMGGVVYTLLLINVTIATVQLRVVTMEGQVIVVVVAAAAAAVVIIIIILEEVVVVVSVVIHT
jgi:O-acetylhomoserine/O-acetylserine sulfhydrylase-like pyridoxal-dependent enzyme